MILTMKMANQQRNYNGDNEYLTELQQVHNLTSNLENLQARKSKKQAACSPLNPKP